MWEKNCQARILFSEKLFKSENERKSLSDMKRLNVYDTWALEEST